jgi:SCY1-like protein 1
MNFLKSLGGLVGANAATGGLPYVIDAPPPSSSSSSSSSSIGDAGTECGAFLLFPGHAKSDATHAVSIFKSRDAASPPSQNALRRIKTLRHPNVLAFLDGVETPNNGPVILVTERVTPLPQFLEELRRQCETPDAFQQSVAWGLRSILLALQFLTVDCKLLHGRVSPHSVFVTKGGDWKLAGLELTGEVSERGPSSHFTAYESMWADPQYKSPEWQRRDWSAMAPPSSVDMYAFAALAFYVLNDSQLRVGELASATNIPHALRMPYRKALDADPHKRPRPDKVLAASFFDSAFIKRMDFVENLAVKTPEEKVEFFKELSTHLPTLPPLFAVHKVLPALKAVVEFGTSKTSSSAVLKLDPSASHMLPAMVQIGSTLLTPDEFKDQVLPVLVKLFSCNDRAVRVQLLQMLEKFAVHLDAKLVNSAVIFDNLCSGFTDAAPVLRELTVKSMLHIADKLSDANLNTRVMKHFAKLQV